MSRDANRNLFDMRAAGGYFAVDAFMVDRAQAEKRDLVSLRKAKQELGRCLQAVSRIEPERGRCTHEDASASTG
jgi:hypothetical protein